MTSASAAQAYPIPSSRGPLRGGSPCAVTIQCVTFGPHTVITTLPAIASATTARVKSMLF